MSSVLRKDLERLIDGGVLRAGTELHHRARTRPQRNVTAKVVRGGIALDGQTYTTPSAAAKSVTGAPVDGWLFWRLPDGRKLDALRQDLPS